MSRKRLNPFEKEFLIRQFRENSSLKLREFCEANRVTPTIASDRRVRGQDSMIIAHNVVTTVNTALITCVIDCDIICLRVST